MNQAEMLQSILDSFPYKVIFVDTDFIIRFMNKKAREVYCEGQGLGEMVGKNLMDYHPPHAKARHEQLLAQAMTNKESVFLSIHADNTQAYFNPVYDANGELIGYFQRFENNLTME